MNLQTLNRRNAETQRKKEIFGGGKLFVCFLIFVSAVSAREISIVNRFQRKIFPLIYKNQAAEIYVSKDDFQVAQIAANDFAEDV